MRYLGLGLLLVAAGCGGSDGLGARGGANEGEGEGEGGGEGEGEGEGGGDAVGCDLRAPAAGAFLKGEVEFDLALTGPVVRAELLIGGDVVATTDVTEGDGEAKLTLPTDDLDDGDVDVTVRVHGPDDQQTTGDPLTVTVDNTSPRVSIESDRFQILFGRVTLKLDISEPNVAAVRLIDQATEAVLVTKDEAVTDLVWDSTGIEDDLYRLTVEVEDEAGNVGRAQDFPVIIAYFGTEAAMEWYPPAEYAEGESAMFSYVPANYSQVEFHTRFSTPSVPGVRKIIVWVTWEKKEDWLLELAIGQGICPHQGIKYVSEESRDGELVISLARAEVDPVIVAESFPRASQDTDTFPVNDDPRTFGLFFGHMAPMDPADHVEEKLPLDGHMVLLMEP